MMRMTATFISAVLILMTMAEPVRAQENTFEVVLKDGLYGGLAGTLVGGAVLAFSETPSDHLNYLAYGAAIGVFLGTSYGLVQASQSMLQLEDGRLSAGLPMPRPVLESGPVGPDRMHRSGASARTQIHFRLFAWMF
jgi:hypothetical protein